MHAKTLLAQDHSAPVKVEIGSVCNPGTSLVPIVSSKIPSTTLFLILLFGFLKKSQRDRCKEKKKRRSTCRIRRNNTAVSTGVLKARHLWTNLALSCVAGTHSFEKQYKNRLMQNQAMEITAGRAMQHRAILGDFASPDSQIAMETSIIGCRIARFCFSVTGLLGPGHIESKSYDCASSDFEESLASRSHCHFRSASR